MRVVIVEDEPSIAERLERLAREILGEKLKRLRHFLDVDNAVDYICEHPIDLLLLDLNLSGRNGFDVLQHTAAESYQTIIVSAFAERAITAFEWGVLDFVNKPFGKDRLERALNRFLDSSHRNAISAKYLSVRTNGALEIIPIESVKYVRGADNYSELVLADGKTRLHDKPLGKLLAILPADFLQVHKSYIARMSLAKRLLVHQGGKYELELDCGTLVPIGRTRYKKVHKAIS